MTPTRWRLPKDLIETSVRIMRPNGQRGCEGLALWLGQEANGVVSVTHVVELVGPGLSAAPMQLRLSVQAVARLTTCAYELQRYWAGQIHSHPGTFLDLSNVDKDMGVRVQDFLSLVCPHYATRPTRDVEECGVHVFENGRYRRLHQPEIDTRITIDDREVVQLRLEVVK